MVSAPVTAGPLADPGYVAGLRVIGPGPTAIPEPRSAPDIRGVTPGGTPIVLRIADADHHLLLAFLHAECAGCTEFWHRFREPETLGLAPGMSVAVITKGPGTASSKDVASSAAGVDRVPVVMSDQAWTDYRILGYPFFVLVEAVSNRVVGETLGLGWSDVVGMTQSASRRGPIGTSG
ncbi:MAG: hypothetical protein ACYCV7_00865 [Acidimicrobiales bacterium]